MLFSVIVLEQKSEPKTNVHTIKGCSLLNSMGSICLCVLCVCVFCVRICVHACGQDGKT